MCQGDPVSQDCGDAELTACEDSSPLWVLKIVAADETTNLVSGGQREKRVQKLSGCIFLFRDENSGTNVSAAAEEFLFSNRHHFPKRVFDFSAGHTM